MGGARVEAGAQAARAQQRVDKRAGRALALRAGHVDHRERADLRGLRARAQEARIIGKDGDGMWEGRDDRSTEQNSADYCKYSTVRKVGEGGEERLERKCRRTRTVLCAVHVR